MDGCWHGMTFQIMFELNANVLLEYTGCSQVKRFCSSLRRFALLYPDASLFSEASSEDDVMGGSIESAVVGEGVGHHSGLAAACLAGANCFPTATRPWTIRLSDVLGAGHLHVCSNGYVSPNIAMRMVSHASRDVLAGSATETDVALSKRAKWGVCEGDLQRQKASHNRHVALLLRDHPTPICIGYVCLLQFRSEPRLNVSFASPTTSADRLLAQVLVASPCNWMAQCKNLATHHRAFKNIQRAPAGSEASIWSREAPVLLGWCLYSWLCDRTHPQVHTAVWAWRIIQKMRGG